ncbi:glutamate--tRNA ligase family protein [uncultured Algimonas sp.]|uniref:glutamate--tRNA ligase family protein n=1 Tax=uncultured Algimonas sp. TaxID=1547920 RepID=UPI0026044B78|nr:glutamate--tRNA ligase family protein [uncultured Algimonas sp.]
MLTRFAPSPTGYLHLGHAYAAARAFEFGHCLLRIEDIDHTRSRPRFRDAIFRDLRWLGFDWPEPVRVQSGHLADYAGVVAALGARDLTYDDYTTRRGEADMSRPPAIKLSVDRCIDVLGAASLSFSDRGRDIPVDLRALPDPTLERRDIGTSYHVAVTHDDALQGITDIVRGTDLFSETGVHRLIQALMGWPEPRYHHHPLVMETAERKMSKRTGSQTIRSLRDSGMSATEVLDLAEARAEG